MDEIDGICFGKKNYINHNEPIDGAYRNLAEDEQTCHSSKGNIKQHYHMRHKHRGKALIFNHMYFSDKAPRQGTDVDCDRLKRCFSDLGFRVKIYSDLGWSDIRKKIAKNVSHDHSSYDCFAMIVLTHGDQGLLYSKTSAYSTDELWTSFNDKRCPTLAGKPKLFFIQACQGEQYDKGVILRRTETDGTPETLYKEPHQPDVLVAMSSPPGFYSWRNSTEGSWFIQALCEGLENDARNSHLLELLTSVTRRVAIDYESHSTNDPRVAGMKQTVCVHSTLTRLLHFYELDS